MQDSRCVTNPYDISLSGSGVGISQVLLYSSMFPVQGILVTQNMAMPCPWLVSQSQITCFTQITVEGSQLFQQSNVNTGKEKNNVWLLSSRAEQASGQKYSHCGNILHIQLGRGDRERTNIEAIDPRASTSAKNITH